MAWTARGPGAAVEIESGLGSPFTFSSPGVDVVEQHVSLATSESCGGRPLRMAQVPVRPRALPAGHTYVTYCWTPMKNIVRSTAYEVGRTRPGPWERHTRRQGPHFAFKITSCPATLADWQCDGMTTACWKRRLFRLKMMYFSCRLKQVLLPNS